MRPLHIIMPMAGEGSRFRKDGWTTPKPLIELRGIPLFARAIQSVAIPDIQMKYSFIVRQEHIDDYEIDKQIKNILPEVNLFSVEKTTKGAVETCLLAEPAIDRNDAVIIMDCDLEFRSISFLSTIRDVLSCPITEVDGGALVSFESCNPKYSYAEIDKDNRVIRTAEKKVISNHALCGAYFFSAASGFLTAAHRLLDDVAFAEPEYYVSLLYNNLLENDETVLLCNMEEYYSYGTPEELKRYL